MIGRVAVNETASQGWILVMLKMAIREESNTAGMMMVLER
jgi:hypothetical protein